MLDLGPEKICPSCQTKNASMVRRCRACGADLPKTAVQAPGPSPAPPAAPPPDEPHTGSPGGAKIRLVHPGGDPGGGPPVAAPAIPPAPDPAPPGAKIRLVRPDQSPGPARSPSHGVGPDGTIPMSPADVHQALAGSASSAPARPRSAPVAAAPAPMYPAGAAASSGAVDPVPPVPAAPRRSARRGGGGALSLLAIVGLTVGAVSIALLAAHYSRRDETPDPAPIPVPTASGGASASAAPSASLTADPGPTPAPAAPSASPQPLDAGFRDRLKKATVLIQVRSALQAGMGSGFFVDPDGLIATNHHVIDGPGTVSVRLYGMQQDIEDVTCVAEDPRRDLALLRLGGVRPEHVLTLHRGSPVPETTPVVVVGHPRGEFWSMTLGTVTGYRTRDGQPFVGTDARIEPGNSGGPVAMQGTGEVIGISDWKIVATNLNYAIPVQALIDFIQRNGSRPGSPCRH